MSNKFVMINWFCSILTQVVLIQVKNLYLQTTERTQSHLDQKQSKAFKLFVTQGTLRFYSRYYNLLNF